jgi:glutamyl-tRNA synthetase
MGLARWEGTGQYSVALAVTLPEVHLTVRTRIAPSPTGDPHVGTAYIALFNYCFAKKHGGKFILRIEDTDQVRSTRESEQQILDALRWVGLEWDEGPDVGGPKGPYRQSERSELYREHCDILLDRGHAFRCFCTSERLTQVRREQMAARENMRYDGHCLDLDVDEIAQRLAAGEPHVVRMKVPTEGVCVIQDRLRGEIEIEWQQVDMQVLLKSDGLPTYHLANVVDDHLMEITHVLRGEEWINSAPKHLLLYEYFGWTAPELCHMVLLRNPDKSKLSKRKNPTGILYYERLGILPEALLNYLGRMAWSMPDDRERFSLDEMVEHFDLDRISLGGPVFDVTKLEWLNGLWIRDMDDEALVDAITKWALNPEYLMPILGLVRKRIKVLGDLVDVGGFFLQGRINLTAEDLVHKTLSADEVKRVLVYSQWRLDTVKTWDAASIDATLRSTAEMMEIELRSFLSPFFVAVSGRKSATPLFDTMAHLGRDMTRARLRGATDALGGVSGKQQKKWKKAFDGAVAAHARALDAG